MKIAFGLTALATLLAAVVGYGTHPFWARYPHGLDVILFSRQVQWPAMFVSTGAALAVVALVIAGKQRAWWLIGLAPLLALFAHRFATDPNAGMASVENPTFVSATEATFVRDDDFVVGLVFGDKAYAYPYAALYSTPVVVHAQHDRRILVMWSPTANRAVATTIKRDLRARHLDVVSMPANALLLYDTARGDFINGLTGLTTAGVKPAGFMTPVATAKMRWLQWRRGRPDTLVMVPQGKLAAHAPRQPLAPSWPMPKESGGERARLAVVVVGSKSPAAVASDALHDAPVNLRADGTPVVLFRDPRGGAVRAFARQLEDLSPRFLLTRDPARAAKGAMFVDTDTDCGWNADGVAVDGKKEFRNRRLTTVAAEDGLYWGVMKHWYPQLELAAVEPPRVVMKSPAPPAAGPATKIKSKPDRRRKPTPGATSAGTSPRRSRVQSSRAE